MITTVLCSCIVYELHDLFDFVCHLCVFEEKVTSARNSHVNIANRIQINKLSTVDSKSITATYCRLSTICVVGVFVSQLQDLISLRLSSNTKTIVFVHI